MKNQTPNHILLTLLLVMLGVYGKANTCANAYSINLISCGPVYSSLTSTFGEPTLATNPCALASGTEGVNWYTFTGTGDQVQASTISSFTYFDTKIWVFEGTCGALNCVGANDDYGGGTSSQLSFPTTLGVTYFIVVGGNGNAEGEYQLNVDSGQSSFGPTMAVTACNSYTTPGGNVYSTSGTYYDTIPNAAGCDSFTTIALTIQSIDNTVVYTGTAFLSNASGVDFQWIDCATGNPLPGETYGTLVPPGPGSYAVIVSNGVCTDTSDCISENVGIDENGFEIEVTVYPNPTSGIFKIQLPNGSQGELFITDGLGKIIHEAEITSETMEIDLGAYENGLYLIFVKSHQGSSTCRIMKR